jgi:hypothetical protein
MAWVKASADVPGVAEPGSVPDAEEQEPIMSARRPWPACSFPGRACKCIGVTADDLFEYQAIPQGGWVMADVAGCAF